MYTFSIGDVVVVSLIIAVGITLIEHLSRAAQRDWPRVRRNDNVG